MGSNRYVVGDVVRIRSRNEIIGILDHNATPSGLCVPDKMLDNCGEETTITSVIVPGRYKVRGNNWTWDDHLLEDCGEEVTVDRLLDMLQVREAVS